MIYRIRAEPMKPEPPVITIFCILIEDQFETEVSINDIDRIKTIN